MGSRDTNSGTAAFCRLCRNRISGRTNGSGIASETVLLISMPHERIDSPATKMGCIRHNCKKPEANVICNRKLLSIFSFGARRSLYQ